MDDVQTGYGTGRPVSPSVPRRYGSFRADAHPDVAALLKAQAVRDAERGVGTWVHFHACGGPCDARCILYPARRP
jgi:hypothetical protein